MHVKYAWIGNVVEYYPHALFKDIQGYESRIRIYLYFVCRSLKKIALDVRIFVILCNEKKVPHVTGKGAISPALIEWAREQFCINKWPCLLTHLTTKCMVRVKGSAQWM